MANPDSRQQAIFRRRRAVAGAAALVFVALVWALIGGGGSHSTASHAPPVKPPAPRPQESSIDRALGYTDYVEGGTRHQREVAFTFDDGPSIWTPRLIKVLQRKHIPATFFPVGYAIQRYPQYLKLEQRDGFVVGDHTMHHPAMQKFDIFTQAHEIDDQASLVTAAGVPYPRLFRPPYGSFNQETRELLAERRMFMVLWSVNPQDYYRPGAQVIVTRTLAAVHPGAIVLMHDGGGDRSQTVAAVSMLARKLRARGYRFVTIPRLLADDPPPRLQGPPPNLSGI